MPIRLLFLLLFLPSTFLSSHKVCHHVDALALYEPHNVGWTGHLFHSSSQSAAFLALLSSNTPPVSELKPDAFSELFLEREGSRWAAFGQDQTKSQTIIPPKSHEPEKIPEQSAQLQRRQFATNEPIQETVAGNLDQETRRSRAEELSSEPPDSSPNQAPSGKSTPSKASQNSPVKAETQSPPIFDEGMRGLVIILMVASFTGIFLFIRIKLVGQAPSQTLEVSEKEDFVLPPVVPDYKGGANITAPLGSGYATKSSRKDSIASQIPLKTEIGIGKNKVKVTRPAVSSHHSGKSISLPASVKIAKPKKAVPQIKIQGGILSPRFGKMNRDIPKKIQASLLSPRLAKMNREIPQMIQAGLASPRLAKFKNGFLLSPKDPGSARK